MKCAIGFANDNIEMVWRNERECDVNAERNPDKESQLEDYRVLSASIPRRESNALIVQSSLKPSPIVSYPTENHRILATKQHPKTKHNNNE